LRPRTTVLTPRQWRVVQLRATGLTQSEVAKKLKTSQENISIIEHRAHLNIRAARATLIAIEQLSESNEVIIPSGTNLFEAVLMVLSRADMLRIKLRISADLLLAAIRSKCKGRIRGHHLTAVVRIRISDDGKVTIQ
jgi:Tfx family DNA-binding protein